LFVGEGEVVDPALPRSWPGDRLPGDGFFTLAEELGMNADNRSAFWEEHVNRVYEAYRDQKA
jgi:hypothetical protein